MDSTIGIDDSSAGIGMHAGRPHVVTRSAHRGRPRIGFSSHRARHVSEAAAQKVLAEDSVCAVRRRFVD
jgi:hypothetical protein